MRKFAIHPGKIGLIWGFFILFLPGVMRFDSWPVANYPMFSYGLKMESVWGFVPVLEGTAGAQRYRLHLVLKKTGWLKLNEKIQVADFEAALKILKGESLNWPQELSHFRKIKIYQVSNASKFGEDAAEINLNWREVANISL